MQLWTSAAANRPMYVSSPGLPVVRVPGVSSPTRIHRFWGNFRVGGYPPATREDVQNTCESVSTNELAI